MRSVDVRIHRRETVGKTLGNERLRRQVITLVESMLADDAENARITFQARGMQCDSVEEVLNAIEAPLRIFQRDPANQAMNFIIVAEQKFSQITAVLTGEPGYERSLSHLS